MNDTDTPAARRYASRKWLGFLVLVAVAVALQVADKLTPLVVDLLKWAFGLYCGFNVTQKVGEWVATLFTAKKEST